MSALGLEDGGTGTVLRAEGNAEDSGIPMKLKLYSSVKKIIRDTELVPSHPCESVWDETLCLPLFHT